MTALARRESTGLRSLFPFAPMGLMRGEFDNLLSRMGDWDGQWANQFLAPSLDVAETEDCVDVTMDVPGMKAENIDIQVAGNHLTISGVRSEEKEEKGNGKSFHHVERHLGHFSRSITLPCDVNAAKVEATYDQGVLKIQLPKSEEMKAHKIKVFAKDEQDMVSAS
ncbi:MAG: Hsp20/alpha crystallin family protein [Planctomycetota bacterium]